MAVLFNIDLLIYENKKHARADSLHMRKPLLVFNEMERIYLKDLSNTTRNRYGSKEYPPTHTSISDIKPSFVPHWLKLQEVHLQDSKLWSQEGGTCMHVYSHCPGSLQQAWPKKVSVAGAVNQESCILIYVLRLFGFIECKSILPMEKHSDF